MLVPGSGRIDDSYIAAIAKLWKRFVAAVNRTVERRKFRPHAQFPDERIEDYVAMLRDLAASF